MSDSSSKPESHPKTAAGSAPRVGADVDSIAPWFAEHQMAEGCWNCESVEGIAPDERASDAIGIIRDAQQPDGTWVQERRHPGRVWFELDVPVGEPSPWLTFLSLRVLRWWEEGGRS